MTARRRPARASAILRAALLLVEGGGAVLALGGRPLAAQRTPASRIVLEGATVIDVRSGDHIPNAVVVVAGGRIERVAPAGERRQGGGGRVVDVRGKFIIPGLWDMHVEQALPLREGLAVDSNAAFFHPLFIAHGVTGVRDVAGALPILRRWQRDVEAGTHVGPRTIATGPKLSPRATNATHRVTTPAEAAAATRALRRAGAGAIYISDIADSLHVPLIRTMRGAGLGVEGTLPDGTTLWTAAERGQRVVDHFDGALMASADDEGWVRRRIRWNAERPWWLRALWKLRLVDRPAEPGVVASQSWQEERATALSRHLARHRTYQVPTLRLLGTLMRADDPLLKLPPAPLELRPPRRPWRGWERETVDSTHPLGRTWRTILRTVAVMQREGAPLMAASDAPNLYAAPGVGLHDELGLLVRAGLTPLQALRTATLTPAEYLGATDTLGTVAAGRVADLVILDADPLRDIANTRRIAAVMARGRFLDRRALDSLSALGVARAAEVERYWLARQAEER